MGGRMAITPRAIALMVITAMATGVAIIATRTAQQRAPTEAQCRLCGLVLGHPSAPNAYVTSASLVRRRFGEQRRQLGDVDRYASRRPR